MPALPFPDLGRMPFRRTSSFPDLGRPSTLYGGRYWDTARSMLMYDEGQGKSVKNRKKIEQYVATEFMLEKASGEVVLSLNYVDVRPDLTLVTSSDGCSYITSYSMKETKDEEPPVIYVPGSAPMYKKPTDSDFPLIIPHDTGKHYNDEHSARFPQNQYLPMFRGMEITNPSFCFDDEGIDVVINRSIVEKFIRFLKGTSDQAYHLELTIEGNTLFIFKKTRNPKSRSAPGTCGRNFETHLTEQDPELEDATGHHRYTSVSLGSLKLIVRYEVDGQMKDADVPADDDRPPSHYPESLSDVNPAAVDLQRKDCVVIPKGTIAPQENLLELKSSAKSRPIDQLYHGRTRNSVIAKGRPSPSGTDLEFGYKAFRTDHTPQRGDKSFEDYEDKNRTHHKSENKDYLEKLVALLQKLINATKQTKHRSAVLISLGDPENQRVTVYEAKERIEVGPKEIVEKFWSKKE